MLSDVTASKYPKLRWSIVGSVFLLRFISPALCSPEGQHLVTKEISGTQRKGLILLSKMMQCANNGSFFQDENKEPNAAYDVLNDWVRTQTGGLEDLFSQLVTVSERDWQLQRDLSSPSPRSGSASPNPRRRSFTAGLHEAALGGSSSTGSSAGQSAAGSAATTPNNNSNVPLLNVPPHRPQSGPTSPVSHNSAALASRASSDSSSTSNLLSGLGEKLRGVFSREERLGSNLSPDESLALRLRVLDTLIRYQDAVKQHLSNDMASMTQWAWLRESLQSFMVL